MMAQHEIGLWRAVLPATIIRVEVIGVGIWLRYVGRVTGRGEPMETINMV